MPAAIKDLADLEPAARELRLTVQESGFFQRDDPVPGLGAAPQVAAAAFTLQDTAVSQPLGTPRGPVFITVSERKDPYVPKLDEVKERVREDLIQARATELSQAARDCGCRRAEVGEGLRRRRQGAGARGQGHRARSARRRDARRRREPRGRHGVFAAGRIGQRSDSDRPTARSSSAWSNATRSRRTSCKQAQEAFRAELLNERRARFFSAYMGKAKEKMKVEVNTDVIRRVLAAYQL